MVERILLTESEPDHLCSNPVTGSPDQATAHQLISQSLTRYDDEDKEKRQICDPHPSLSAAPRSLIRVSQHSWHCQSHPSSMTHSLSPLVISQLNSCNVHKHQFHIFPARIPIDSPDLAFRSFHWSLRKIAVKEGEDQIIQFSVTFLCSAAANLSFALTVQPLKQQHGPLQFTFPQIFFFDAFLRVKLRRCLCFFC